MLPHVYSSGVRAGEAMPGTFLLSVLIPSRENAGDILAPSPNILPMKQLLLLFVLALAGNLYAHQSDVSTTMLVEQEPGKWQLYLNCSLNAFEYEVKQHFGEQSFTTPEEFQDLVLQHLQRNLDVRFNGGNRAVLSGGKVKLGHETGVVFTLVEVPDGPRELRLTNTVFADIHQNRSILVVLMKDREKVQLELSADNAHTAHLNLGTGEIRSIAAAGVPGQPVGYLPLLLLGVLGLAGLLFLGVRTSQLK